MFMQAYKQAFSVLAKKPLRLWGLSLLSGLVCAFAALLTFPFLGIVGAGMIVNDLLQCVHEIDIELTGICATKRNVEHLVQLAGEHGFKNWYTDYDEMLENE